MSDIFERMRADADQIVLADPATLRRIGTRRTRIKLGVAALAVLAVIAGSTASVNSYFTRGHAPVVPGETASPSPAPTLASPSVPAVTSPSAEAPVGGGTPPPDPCADDVKQCYPPARFFYDEKLPAPCATTSHLSESRKLARRSTGTYVMIDGETGRLVGPDDQTSQPATTGFGQTITRYSGGGATQYLDEVAAAVDRCSSVRRPSGEWGTGSATITIRYRMVSRDKLGGDRSLLLSRTHVVPAGETSTPREETFLIGVVKVGDVVVVLMDYGWEGNPSFRRSFDEFLARSVTDARQFTG